MNRIRRLALILLALLMCVGCDQATKSVARTMLAASPPVVLWNGIIRFEYLENSGAFLSLGATLPPPVRFLLLVAFSGIALVVLLVVALRTRQVDRWQLTGISLFVGGGVGNLIDRVLNAGAVVDFVSIGVGPLRTGTFNVADVAIMAGVAVFLWAGVQQERRTEHGDEL